MAPALKIPVRLDMDSFRQNVAEARSKVQEATDFMVRQLEKAAAKSAVFDLPRLIQNNDTARQITQKTIQAITSDLGKLTALSAEKGIPFVIENQLRSLSAVMTTVAMPAAQGFASALLPLVARAGAVYAAYKILEATIAAVSNELERMVDVADKAQSRGLSPEAFQAFVAAGKGAADTVSMLEGALDSFFQAQKRRLDESVSPDATDAEKEKWTELGKAIRDARFELLAANAVGPKTFLNAGADMNKQLLGVVQTMKELNDEGQKLAALDIAQKAFGSQFADNIRTGKITIDEIANTVQTKLNSGVAEGSIFSNQTVQRAKEIDDQLKEAWRTVDKNLHPSMEALDNVALNLKSVWVDIVKLMAEGAKILAGLTTVASSQNQEYVQLNNQLTTINTKLRDAGLTPLQRSGLEEQQRTVLARMAQIDLRSGNLDVAPKGDIGGGVGIPLPRRRPTNIPEPSRSSAPSETKDAFDRQIDSLNREMAVMDADSESIGKNVEERARMRAEAQLTEALTRAGIEIDDEHAAIIDKVADAYGKAAQKAADAKTAFQGINDATAFFGHALENALSNLNSQTKGIDLLRSALSDLSRELIRAAITGEGAFAKILGTASTTGGTGGLFGAIASLFKADGGPIGLANGGGPFRGRGTSRSDSNLVFLSDGEYVVNAAAAKQYRAMLDQINFASGYATGGPIGLNSVPSIAPSAGQYVFSPVTHIDARGSTLSKKEINDILATNNQTLRQQWRGDFGGGMIRLQKFGHA